eukprot:1181648-Prorocentrum_minimum.AAC.3
MKEDTIRSTKSIGSFTIAQQHTTKGSISGYDRARRGRVRVVNLHWRHFDELLLRSFPLCDHVEERQPVDRKRESPNKFENTVVFHNVKHRSRFQFAP